MAGGIILDVGYGLDIKSADDPYIRRAAETLAIIGKAVRPPATILPKMSPEMREGQPRRLSRRHLPSTYVQRAISVCNSPDLALQ